MKNKLFYSILILITIYFFAFNYINNHLAEIAASRANYYYKKNNIEKAQFYFEKAFDLGVQDSKIRDIYVNSIINSPLTIESQEKLDKILQNPTDDYVKLKVEYFMYDLQQEIHKKYPGNYITNAVFNKKIMRWGSCPITYGFENTDEVPNYFFKEINNAFSEWEKATEHQISFKESENPNIIIKFETNNPVNNEEKKYIAAYTSTIMDLSKLKNMEIVFYLKDSVGNYFSQNQVYNTALHEIVHALGFMGHCSDKNNIMYLTKDSVSVANDTRENLTEADINTVKLLYKIKPQITNVDESTSEYIPALVLGKEKDITNAKIKEAQLYIKKAPKLPTGYIDLAEGYSAIKDYKRAEKSLHKALLYANSDCIKDIIYFNLALINFYQAKYTSAEQYLQMSIQIKYTEEKQYLLAEIYTKNDKTKEAVKEYSELIKKNPNNIEYTIALANIYVIKHNYLKAREVLKQYFSANPGERNNPRFNSYGVIKLCL